MNDTMRVAIYARVSTTEQSTDSQLLDLRRYVSERQWGSFKEYVDNGISGTVITTVKSLLQDWPKMPWSVVKAPEVACCGDSLPKHVGVLRRVL